MQVVDTLEVLFDLRVIEAYHLDHLLDGGLVLAALQIDAQLPLASLDPELKRACAFAREERLGLLVGFLRQE